MDGKDWDDPKNWEFGIRGGCDREPMDLLGEHEGFNNAPTAQIGLWILNDGWHIDLARQVAIASGPEALKAHLISVMRTAPAPHSAPARAWGAAVTSGGGIPCVDWVQIAYSLIDDEPDDDDLDRAGEIFAEQYGRPGTDAEVFALAAQQREMYARSRATGVL